MFSSQWRNRYPEASVLWGKRVHQRDTLILASNRIWLMSPHCNDIINSFQGPLPWSYSLMQRKERKETTTACCSFIKMSDGCENFLLIYHIWNMNLISTVLKQKLLFAQKNNVCFWVCNHAHAFPDPQIWGEEKSTMSMKKTLWIWRVRWALEQNFWQGHS